MEFIDFPYISVCVCVRGIVGVGLKRPALLHGVSIIIQLNLKCGHAAQQSPKGALEGPLALSFDEDPVQNS